MSISDLPTLLDCPMCGDFVPYTTALDDGEDVRWAEWSCPCGLYYHAESRIVNERGVHDAEAELAELFAAWNTRAVRTCRIVEDEDGRPSCSLCGANYLCMCEATFCPDCGAKVVNA